MFISPYKPNLYIIYWNTTTSKPKISRFWSAISAPSHLSTPESLSANKRVKIANKPVLTLGGRIWEFYQWLWGGAQQMALKQTGRPSMWITCINALINVHKMLFWRVKSAIYNYIKVQLNNGSKQTGRHSIWVTCINALINVHKKQF